MSDGTEPNGEPMNVAYYSAILTAWHSSMLERDKSVLTLASAGLAAMVAGTVTLSTTEKLTQYWWLLPAMFSLIYFFACLLKSLKIFRCNADYLDKVHSETDTLEDEKQLRAMKDEAEDALALGIFFSVFTGLAVVVQRLMNPFNS